MVNEDDKHRFRLKGENAEQFIHSLAQQSFLTDWCYPNPKLPDGKELCDLLVVFDDIAIIWQIKDIKLRGDGHFNKKDVSKNFRQLSGARRQLFEIAKSIFLDNPNRGIEEFDPTCIERIFLISVLPKGAPLFPLIETYKHHTLHCFTQEFSEICLNELDTIGDFTSYLIAKENLIASTGTIVISDGEEELLAVYLSQNKTFDDLLNTSSIVIESGGWEKIVSSPKFKSKSEADPVSYEWDKIIEQAHNSDSHEYEIVARELARPKRFERRVLAKAFWDGHFIAEECTHWCHRRNFESEGITYCFLYQCNSIPRKDRQNHLSLMCDIARGIYPNNKKVIGIATQKKIRKWRSFDFCLLEHDILSEEYMARILKLQQETGIFLNSKQTKVGEDEYPGYQDGPTCK